MTTYIITAAQLESVRAGRLQLLDSPNKSDHTAASWLDWAVALLPTSTACPSQSPVQRAAAPAAASN